MLLHTPVHDSKRANPREAAADSYFLFAICYTLLFFDTLLHMTVLMVETKAKCDEKLGWSALHDSLNSGGVNPEL